MDLGDRVIVAPSQQSVMSKGLLINSYLSTLGYFDGMVLGVRPDAPDASPFPQSSRRSGWIHLRLPFIGERRRDWPFLKRVEELRHAAGDDGTRGRLDLAYEKGEQILNWLADLETHLKRRTGPGAPSDIMRLLAQIEQARSNIWDGPGGDCRLIVGRSACRAATTTLHELDQLIAPNPGAVPDLVKARDRLAEALGKARELGFADEDPALSRYEEVLRDYCAHLKRLKAKVRELTRQYVEMPDETRLAELKRVQASLRDDARTMSFRGRDWGGDVYYALIPGHREVAAMLALVEEADKVPPEERLAKPAAPRGGAGVSDPLALAEPGPVLVPRSQEQQHLRYRELYTDPAGHTLVEVSSDQKFLHRYEVYDSLGELVGRFQGRIRVDGQLAETSRTLGPSARVQADFFSFERYDGSGKRVGQDLVPFARIGPVPAAELTARACGRARRRLGQTLRCLRDRCSAPSATTRMVRWSRCRPGTMERPITTTSSRSHPSSPRSDDSGGSTMPRIKPSRSTRTIVSTRSRLSGCPDGSRFGTRA